MLARHQRSSGGSALGWSHVRQELQQPVDQIPATETAEAGRLGQGRGRGPSLDLCHLRGRGVGEGRRLGWRLDHEPSRIGALQRVPRRRRRSRHGIGAEALDRCSVL